MRFLISILILVSTFLNGQDLVVPGANPKAYESIRIPTLCKTKKGFEIQLLKISCHRETHSIIDGAFEYIVKFHKPKGVTPIIGFYEFPLENFGPVKGKFIHTDIPKAGSIWKDNFGSPFQIETKIGENKISITINIKGETQVLLDSCYPDCDSLVPYWIGDIDNDGIPDILCFWGHEGTVGGVLLFISRGDSKSYTIFKNDTWAGC